MLLENLPFSGIAVNVELLALIGSIRSLLFAQGASVQSIAGPATISVLEISNTCGEVIGAIDVAMIDIEESG